MDSTFHIDDFGPLPLKRPPSVGDLGDLVRQAADASQAIYPLGGQTRLNLGYTPTRPGWALDLRSLDQVIDFPARDMTITVQAGITMARLQEILARENLRLPLDVPQAMQATLGGALATNTSGSRRFGFGTLRDYVIGIAAVNDAGNEFKAGGRVVKNVAGYDLCKLLVGSLGTLAIISQVTLKLRPLAEQQALVCLPCRGENLGMLAEKLLASRTRPMILDVVNQAAGEALFEHVHTPYPKAEWVFVVGFEANDDAVKWQVQHLVKELGTGFPMEARVGYTSKPLDTALAEWPSWPAAKLTLRASVPPSAVSELCLELDAIESPCLRAHVGNGILLGHFARDLTMSEASRILTLWREHVGRVGGAVVLERCPAAWKRELGVWGSPPSSLALMRQVKAKFDPRGLFNPGRFLEGLDPVSPP